MPLVFRLRSDLLSRLAQARGNAAEALQEAAEDLADAARAAWPVSKLDKAHSRDAWEAGEAQDSGRAASVDLTNTATDARGRSYSGYIVRKGRKNRAWKILLDRHIKPRRARIAEALADAYRSGLGD